MDDWNRVESIFNQALKHSAKSRIAYVESCCGDNSGLRQQIVALLEADRDSENFLSTLSEKLYPLINEPDLKSVRHYRLLERLGQGGMGVVYKAYDEKLQRIVAIKFLSSIRAANPTDKERFVQEATAAASLNHPNVCGVYEIGESDDGQLYIVTAFCEGQDLAALIAANQLSLEQVLGISIQLCGALGSAHAKGIVHRDLKPANVIVSEALHVQLVDFGIAKIAGKDISQTGQIIGTFAYMSPEQFSGAIIDQRTDIWSLGVLLYEMLTGKRLYSGDSPAEIMYQLFNRELPGLTEDLPEQARFNQIIARCLSVDRQRRFYSTELVANELKALERSLEQSAQLDTLPSRAAAAEPDGTKTGTASLTLSEYRKVIAMGIDFCPGSGDQRTREAIKKQIKKHGGKVRDGDQLFAYFGFPALGEGAADSALGCALLLMQLYGGASQSGSAVRRIALHNAPVVISNDHLGGRRKLSGDIAASLEPLLRSHSAASVLLSESAAKRLRRSLPDSAQLRLDPNLGEGFYELDDVRDLQVFSSTWHYGSQLMGRYHELGLLESAWRDASEGETRTVMITGDAGMGKTRLIHELKRSIATKEPHQEEPHQIVECWCDPHQQDTALYPIVACIKQLINSRTGEEPEPAEFLDQWLATLGITDSDSSQTLGWLLGVVGNSSLGVRETAESLKNKSYRLLERVVTQLASRTSLLFVVEDLHWADASTIQWLDRLLSRPLAGPVMMVLSGRPELFARWRAHSQLTQLALNKLGRADSRDIIHALSKDRRLPPSLEDLVLDKTAGNPLFVEEYTNMLLGQLPASASPDREAGPYMDERIPDSLEDVLHSRLDYLGGAKVVAQAAAVAGRVFDESPLRDLLADAAASVSHHLAALTEADIIFRSGDTQYTFKHALIRDALYSSMTPALQKSLHQDIGRLLSVQAEAGENQLAESVAHHFSKAQQFDRSVQWWTIAATNARDRHAVVETIRLCHRGLTDNRQERAKDNEKGKAQGKDKRKAQRKTKSEQELALQLILGSALMAAKRNANEATGRPHARALELGEQLRQTERVFPAMVGLWAFYCVRAEHTSAIQLAERMLAIAEQYDSPDFRVEACMARGISALFMGQPKLAIEDFDRSLGLYSPDMGQRHIHQFGQDPAVVVYSFYAIAAESLGEGARALSLSGRSVELGRASRHPFSLAYALGFAVHIHIRQKQVRQAQRLIVENKQLCAEHGIHVFQLLGAIQESILLFATDQTEQGIAALQASILPYKSMGAGIFLASWSAMLAMSYLKLGDIAQAKIALDEGLRQVEKSGELLSQPVLDLVAAQFPATNNN
ncbi:MAG: protein kinase [Cellvibrionaceae bacterium]